MRIKTSINSQDFLKRSYYLAYNASSPMGMGFLQQRDDVSEEDVWNNMNTQHEYADYVFGRMMKWGGHTIDNETIELNREIDHKFNIEYSSFAGKYPTQKDLLDATAKDLDCTYSVKKEAVA